jgi:tRNA threonylcarbamoyladenosine modification (KEOPS) complex Cgi121 subunit
MTENKTAEYTLRIAGKRQVTIPEDILERLGLNKGDEFRLVMHNPTDIRLIPCTRIRRDLITPEIEEILKRRRAEIESGIEMISQEQLLQKAAVKNARRRARSVAKSGANVALRSAQAALQESEGEAAR